MTAKEYDKITAKEYDNLLANISIILVDTTHPGNIGAGARAMKNMAMTHLRLVSPKKFPSDDAVARAAGGVDLLERAEIYGSVDEAVADCGWLVGTSSRSRRIPWPSATVREAASEILQKASECRVGIMFGRESRGLMNRELQMCHQHLLIPADDVYPVLNLAMAVQIVCYELYSAVTHASWRLRGPSDEEWDQPPATVEEIIELGSQLEHLLIKLKFLNPQAPRQLSARLRRLLVRTRLDKMESNMLRGMIRSIAESIADN